MIVIFDCNGSEIVGRFSPDVKLQPTDVVHLAPRNDKLHLFAVEDGCRLELG